MRPDFRDALFEGGGDTYAQDLGVTAASARRLKPGTEYDRLIPAPDFKSDHIKWFPRLDDTLDGMKQIVRNTLGHTEKLAPVLKGETLETTCNNIWHWVYGHIQYKPDRPFREELRSPARLWAERKTGGDCDCYSITIGSILANLRIPFSYRVARYYEDKGFQHVYVIVPSGQARRGYFIIDPVMDEPDAEKTILEKKDYQMQLVYLHGTDGPQGGGGPDDPQTANAVLEELKRTDAMAKANPCAIEITTDPKGFRRMLRVAVDNWHGNRAEALNALADLGSLVDEYHNIDGELDEEELVGLFDTDLEYVETAGFEDGELEGLDGDEDDKDLGALNGIDEYGDALEGEDDDLGRKNRTQRREARSQKKQGKRGAGKFFRKVGDGIKKAAKGAWKGIRRYNPATIAIRNGILAMMRLNLFRVARKLKYGYLTEEQAAAKRFNLNEWRKVKRKLEKFEKTFEKIGGKIDNLRKAILKGKAGGLNGGFHEMSGLGVIAESAVAASVAAAMPFILDLVRDLKEVDYGAMNQGADVPQDEAADMGYDPTAEVEAAQQTADYEATEGFGPRNTLGERWAAEFGTISEAELLGALDGGEDGETDVNGLGCPCILTGNPARDEVLNGFDGGGSLLGLDTVEGPDDGVYTESFGDFLLGLGRKTRRGGAAPRARQVRRRRRRNQRGQRPGPARRQERRQERRNPAPPPPPPQGQGQQPPPRANGLFNRKHETNPLSEAQAAAENLPAGGGAARRGILQRAVQAARNLVQPGNRGGNNLPVPTDPETPEDDMADNNQAVTPSGGGETEAKGFIPWLKKTWESGAGGKAGIIGGGLAVAAGLTYAATELLGLQGLGGIFKKKSRRGGYGGKKKSKGGGGRGGSLNGTVTSVKMKKRGGRK